MPELIQTTLRELLEGDLFVKHNSKVAIQKRQRYVVAAKSKWSPRGQATREVFPKGVPSAKATMNSNTQVIKIIPYGKD